MQVFKSFATATVDQMVALQQIIYKPCPAFLGNFGISYYGHPYGRGNKIPEELRPLAQKMASLHPEQKFNAAFIQRYPCDAFVKPHKDPMTNIGYTLILVLGDFDGPVSQVQGYEDVVLQNGDMMSLECTIDGVQGPLHRVSPVTCGVRYALILNTCV